MRDKLDLPSHATQGCITRARRARLAATPKGCGSETKQTKPSPDLPARFDGVLPRSLTRLETLPEGFFKNQSHLESIEFDFSTNLGAKQSDPLPDGLFRGLGKLTTLSLLICTFRNLPDVSDLTVRRPRSSCPCPRAGGATVLAGLPHTLAVTMQLTSRSKHVPARRSPAASRACLSADAAACAHPVPCIWFVPAATLRLSEPWPWALPRSHHLLPHAVFQSLQTLHSSIPNGHFTMNGTESAAKFDGLVNVAMLDLEGQSLTRIPSLKHMGKLRSLWL